MSNKVLLAAFLVLTTLPTSLGQVHVETLGLSDLTSALPEPNHLIPGLDNSIAGAGDIAFGIVQDSDGNPVRDALVAPAEAGFGPNGEPTLAPLWNLAVRTTQDGQYALPAATGLPLVAASADGTAHGLLASALSEVQQTIRLEPDTAAPVIDQEAATAALPQTDFSAATQIFRPAMPQPPELLAPLLVEQLKANLAATAAADDPTQTPVLVSLIVNDVLTPWPILVPMPADFNGDLVFDGTLTANVDLNLGGLCLDMTYVHSIGSRGLFNFGMVAAGQEIVFQSTSIPDSASACANPDPNYSTVDWTATGVRGDMQAFLLAPNIDFRMSVDQMPSTLSVDVTPPTGENGLYVNYAADRSMYFVFNYFQPGIDVIGHVDRIPQSFSGQFHLSQYPVGGGVEHTWIELDYTASSSIGEIIVLFEESNGDDLQAEARGIPRTLHNYINVRKTSSTVNYVSYQHTASGPIGDIVVAGQVGAYPVFVAASTLPATVNKSYFEQQQWSSGATKTNIHWDSTSSVTDLIAIIGDESSTNMFGLQIPVVPKLVNAYFESVSDGSELDSFWYYTSTSTSWPEVTVIADTGLGDMYLGVTLTDIPTSTLATLDMNRHDDDSPMPKLRYQANAAGMDLVAVVDGRKLGPGGYVHIQMDNLAPEFDTFYNNDWDNHGRIDFTTDGTGSIDLFFIDANLPLAMLNQPTDRFYLYFEDLEHFEVEIKSIILPCPETTLFVKVCQNWNNRDASYAQIFHAELTISPADWLTIAPGTMQYEQQEETWDWVGPLFVYQYHTRYISLTDDLAIYDPTYFESGTHVRALGS